MRQPNVYHKGQDITVEATFRNYLGILIDPTTVTFVFRNPAGAPTTFVFGVDAQVARPSVGVYQVNIDGNMVGWWYYKFYSAGSGKAAGEGSFRVVSNFA